MATFSLFKPFINHYLRTKIKSERLTLKKFKTQFGATFPGFSKDLKKPIFGLEFFVSIIL